MQSHGYVRAVTDQVGTPNCGFGVSNVIWQAPGSGLHRIHHWTNTGAVSRYDFAAAVAEEASAFGLLKRVPMVIPISTTGSTATTPRPTYSVLDKEAAWEALKMRHPHWHWRVHLRLMFKELSAAGECTGDA